MCFLPPYPYHSTTRQLTPHSDGDPQTRSFAMAGLNVWAAVFAATVYVLPPLQKPQLPLLLNISYFLHHTNNPLSAPSQYSKPSTNPPSSKETTPQPAS